jgi:hypothetical protein
METETPMAKTKKPNILVDIQPEFSDRYFTEFRGFGKVNSFLRKYNELLISPLALMVFFAGYYWVYQTFGPEAGLVPPGYFTNVLAGAVIMYVSGVMTTLAMKLNFPDLYKVIVHQEHKRISNLLILSVCIYFAYYGLALLALTSML